MLYDEFSQYGLKKKDKDAEESASLEGRLGRKKKAAADADVAPSPAYEPPPPPPGNV